MSEHPIEGLMASVLENLKKVVDANTVIGEPMNLPNGTSIIPVTKLSCGFGCGGGEYGKQGTDMKMPFGGGTGGMLGVFIGLCILNTFQIGMSAVGLNTYLVQVFSGVLLLVALAFDFIQRRRAGRL